MELDLVAQETLWVYVFHINSLNKVAIVKKYADGWVQTREMHGP